MIDVSKLTKRDVGREVRCTYEDEDGNEDKGIGKIVSWDRNYICVKYSILPSCVSTESNEIGWFTSPDKLVFIEIVTRADLMDLEED